MTITNATTTQNDFIFEIHLTINTVTDDQLELFANLCQTLSAKAILIELLIGQYTQQPMLTKVIKAKNLAQVHNEINQLTIHLSQHHFNVIREKVEIPAMDFARYQQNNAQASIQSKPNSNHHFEHQNKTPANNPHYFEWHGKISFKHKCELELLRQFCEKNHAHLSKNALKQQKNKQNQQLERFATIRESNQEVFWQKVESFSTLIANHQTFQLIKSQSEYCVYDNHINLDNGWTHQQQQPVLPLYRNLYPELDDDELRRLCAYEGFIRRSCQVAQPFMLKGSYITRQYFDDMTDRLPADLDFVCLTQIPTYDSNTAESLLSKWVQAITMTQCADGVFFTQFKENRFWRMIDYAMHDDFPTVNTDLSCTVDGVLVELDLDVSLNLPMSLTPVPLQYVTPLDSFYLPYTVPLALQIAWKIHQTIVRPRLKDLYDLTYLAKKVTESAMVEDALWALIEECEKDNIKPKRIHTFFHYQQNKILPKSMSKNWQTDRSWLLAYCPKIEEKLEDFFQHFADSMQSAGFTSQALRDVM